MRRARILLCVLTATAIVIACGSDDDSSSGSTPDGGVTDSSGNTDGSSPPPPSDGGGDAASDVVSSAGEPCGPDRRCKYQGDVVASSGFPGDRVALALGKTTTGVAHGDAFLVRVAQGTWASSAAAAGQGTSTFLHAAVDANGVQWIAFKDGNNQLAVAHGTAGTTANPDAGLWTVETAIAQTPNGAGIAIGSDGVPVVVCANTAITLARRTSGGTWTPATVATIGAFGSRNVAVAMNGTDPFVAWHDRSNGDVKFAHATGATTFATETIAGGGTFYNDESISIAVDTAGTPHVVYKASNEPIYATRAGGVWTTTPLPRLSFPFLISQSGAVRIAVSPSGVLAVGVAGAIISVATNGGAGWFVQPVTARCKTDEPGLDMAYDGASKLTLVHTCMNDTSLMTHVGNYAPGYDATCTQVATTACNAACTCPHATVMSNDLCCINKGGQGDCSAPTAVAKCAGHYAVSLCGDATQEPAAVTACSTALATPTCRPDDASTPGLELPAPCPAPPP